jgi:hypothetical protein
VAGLTLVVSAGAARADNGLGDLARGAIATVFVAEVLVPDVRLVLGPDDHRWELAWPVVLANLLPVRGESVGLAVLPFLEPEVQPARGALRLAAGVRTLLYSRSIDFQLAPFVELGGVAGEDGTGWFAGAGLALGDPELGITFGLLGRAVQTDQEQRAVIGFDLQLPLSSDAY